jgi:hypothetical protein
VPAQLLLLLLLLLLVSQPVACQPAASALVNPCPMQRTHLQKSTHTSVVRSGCAGEPHRLLLVRHVAAVSEY